MTGFFDLVDESGKTYLGAIVIGNLVLLNGDCIQLDKFRIVRELTDERASEGTSGFLSCGA